MAGQGVFRRILTSWPSLTPELQDHEADLIRFWRCDSYGLFAGNDISAVYLNSAAQVT